MVGENSARLRFGSMRYIFDQGRGVTSASGRFDGALSVQVLDDSTDETNVVAEQADPDPTFRLNRTIEIVYRRGDLFSLPPNYTADDAMTGNPPWGSQPGDGDGILFRDVVGE